MIDIKTNVDAFNASIKHGKAKMSDCEDCEKGAEEMMRQIKKLKKENEELKEIIGDLITFREGTSLYKDAINKFRKIEEQGE